MWLPYHRRPNSSSLYTRRHSEQEDEAIPGFLLKHPKTEILHPENTRFGRIEIGHASMQGYRVNMEDEHLIDQLSLKDHLILAIMDGHAGTYAAKYTARHLKIAVESSDEWMAYKDSLQKSSDVELLGKALLQAFLELDDEMLEMTKAGLMDESGCTCVCAIITPNYVVCANVGDSRCVVGSSTDTVSLTEDHKPDLAEEKERIEKAGGFVQFNRVNGELAMSRALGDFRYKVHPELPVHQQLVIPIPDIAIHQRRQIDKVIILACDGVWDVLQNNEAVEFLTDIVFADNAISNSKKKRKALEISAQEGAENLIQLALSDGSKDNISAIVVKLP